jgi:hypothetical protein
MIKNFLIGFILLTILAIALLGFQGQRRQMTAIEFFGDMKRQDKVKFQKPSSFFADGRAARPPVDGTIPMGYDIPGHPMQNSEVPKDDISSPLGEFSRLIAQFVMARPGRAMESPRNTGCSASQTITRISTGRWQTARSSIRSLTGITR